MIDIEMEAKEKEQIGATKLTLSFYVGSKEQSCVILTNHHTEKVTMAQKSDGIFFQPCGSYVLQFFRSKLGMLSTLIYPLIGIFTFLQT
jgi:hypothetical protein